MHSPQYVIVECQKLTRPSEQVLSFLIEFDATSLATDQHRFPQDSLKPLHLKRDRRLRPTNTGGRASEALFLRYRDEASEQIKVKSDRVTHRS